MHKYFILLGSEILAGAISFLLIIAALLIFNHDVGEFIFDLKTRLIGLALIMPFIKLISGYYLILWSYLRLTKQNLTSLRGYQYLAIFVIALTSILVLMGVDSIRFSGEFSTRFVLLMEEFFLFANPMAKFVYTGIISCLIAPQIARIIRLWTVSDTTKL